MNIASLFGLGQSLTNSLLFLVFTAGTCFGIWPYFLAKSKLSSTAALAAMAFIQFSILFLMPATKLAEFQNTVWKSLIAAAVISSAGMLCFVRIGVVIPQESLRGGPYAATTFIQVFVFIAINFIQNSERLTPTRLMAYCFVGLGMFGAYLLYTTQK